MTPSSDTLSDAEDAEVMCIWRECGLPEYFLGNGGTNHKLVAFAKACALLEREVPMLAEIERLKADVHFWCNDAVEKLEPMREALERAVVALEGLNAAFQGLKVEAPTDRMAGVIAASQAAHAATAAGRRALSQKEERKP